MNYPVVFLDFDGVLNSELYYRSDRYSQWRKNVERVPHPVTEALLSVRKTHYTSEEIIACYMEDIDPQAITFLNELLTETGAKVVVSSCWRNHGVLVLQQILNNRGFTGEITDVTPRGCNCCVRGNEIRQWLRQHGEDRRYVILDDDQDMLWWQRQNFVAVDGYVGLTPTNIYRAKHILLKGAL